jgi:MinD-like ATPase involved in chromosome partitioning or flagellar assembly
MREPTVVLAHSARGWAQDLHFFLMDHGGAVVRGYVMSGDDAIAESYDVLLIDDVTSFLTRRLVGSLQGRGIKVVGVYDADDAHGAGKERLLELGVDEAVPSSTVSAEFVQIIARLAGPLIDDDLELAGILEEVGARQLRGPTHEPPDGPARRPRRGQIVAVAAAAGGAGATEVAVGLAGALRAQGNATVLVDADEQAPAVAQRLGLALHPNIRTAVDAVQHGTGDLGQTLMRHPGTGLEILCGLPNPRDWFELRAGEVAEVVLELSRTRPNVVINAGPRVDDLPDLGGPARFGVTRAMLGISDLLVLVGVATPIGARRIVDWLADAQSLLSSTPVHLFVNQYPGGSFAISELEIELRRTISPASVTVAPYDKRVSRATWEGDPVAKGPFVKSINRLAKLVAPRRGASVS